jgi:Ca-activated chloride channel family protein
MPHLIAAAALLFVAGCGSPTYSSADQSANSRPRTAHDMVIGHTASGSGPHSCVYHGIFKPSKETYASIPENAVRAVTDHPLSTFSIDVDTGSYANVRRFLNRGRLPIPQAVRVEEMINYFTYGYAGPRDQEKPFNVTTEVAPTPWNRHTHLLQIGLKAYEVPRTKRPASNLVFLIDVSGSMMGATKLPLLKSAFRLLVNRMEAHDRISIITYAYDTELTLDTTAGDKKYQILNTLDGLKASGGTNGGAGIQLAYKQGKKAFIPGGINRVILATDGDLNVGIVDFDDLKALIRQRRDDGIELTTLGFGTGNYNDRLLEQLADSGNGNHAYIDNLSEAQKVLVEELNATLMTVAKDVKLQVEFKPATVAEYRLIGYENRKLARKDFSNDKVDAGDIGAGHTVTASYEIALVGSPGRRLENLRYKPRKAIKGNTSELAFVRIRYKQPQKTASRLLEFPVMTAAIKPSLAQTQPRFRFAAAVAAFGQILKGGSYTGDMELDAVAKLAGSSLAHDPQGFRREFVRLVKMAGSLKGHGPQQVGGK